MTQRLTDSDLDALIGALTIQGSKVRFELAMELKETRAELKILRDHRYYASALIDCENRCKKFREALEKISKEVGSVCGGDDAWEIAQEVLK